MSPTLDAPQPGEQPPAKKKAAKKTEMIVLPGAYVDVGKELKTKKGDPMFPLIYGEYSTMLFQDDPYEQEDDGLHVTAVVKSRNWKMANPPYTPTTWDIVNAQNPQEGESSGPALEEEAASTTPVMKPKPAPAKVETAKKKLTQVLDEGQKAGYTPEQMEAFVKQRAAKMPKKAVQQDTTEAEAVKPEEKFDEEEAIRNFHSYFPSPADFDAYEKMAGWMIQRNYGIIEGSKKSKEQQQMELELRLMFCKDLNIPPSFALSLYIVNGKPEMQIDLMMYLIARGCPTAEIEPLKYSKEAVSMRARRNRSSPWITVTWTIEDARKNVKGYDRKDVWKNIPAQMLRSRVLGELGRTVFYPELRGLAYVAGEISDNAPIDDKALPTPPLEKTQEKPSFQVKPPAQIEREKAQQKEDAEIDAILNEQPAPAEEPAEEMTDEESLCNALAAIKGIPYPAALKIAQLRAKQDQKGMKDAFQHLIQEASK